MKKLFPLLLLFVSPLAFAAINLSLSALVEVVIYLLIVGVLICINVLLSFAGSPIFNFR